MQATQVVPLYSQSILEASSLVEEVIAIIVTATIVKIGIKLAAIVIMRQMLAIIVEIMLLIAICLSSFVGLMFVR